MATTKTQEGKLSKLCVPTVTQPRGLSFHMGLTVWRSQVQSAFRNTSMVMEGLPTGLTSSSSAGRSPFAPDRECRQWGDCSQPWVKGPGRLPTEPLLAA